LGHAVEVQACFADVFDAIESWWTRHLLEVLVLVLTLLFSIGSQYKDTVLARTVLRYHERILNLSASKRLARSDV
jgi:hypothetical protein